MGHDRTLYLFSSEILRSYRVTCRRIIRHPIMTAWFFILLITGFSTVLFMAEYVSTLDLDFFFVDRGDILFVAFFFFMGKAASETQDGGYRNDSLKHYFTAPIRDNEIQNMIFLKVLWYNLLLLAISVFLTWVLLSVLSVELFIDGYFFLHLYLVVFLGVIVGFNSATIVNSFQGLMKVVALVIYAQNISLVLMITRSETDHLTTVVYLIFLSLLSFVLFFFLSPVFKDAWIKCTSSSKKYGSGYIQPIRLFRKCAKKPFCRIAEKEMLERWRRKETGSVLGIIVLISIGLVLLYRQLGPEPDLGLGLDEFFYPTFIGMGVFLAVSLQVLIPSLTLFSREGKRMWAIMTLPIEPEEIIKGKLLSLLIFTPLIPITIVLPLTILIGYPITYVLFTFFASITLIFIASGIGIWASARFPNFDESVDGAPDVMTMYIVLMVTLILGGIFVSLPITILLADSLLGLLSITIAMVIAGTFMAFMCWRATCIYQMMQLEM